MAKWFAGLIGGALLASAGWWAYLVLALEADNVPRTDLAPAKSQPLPARSQPAPERKNGHPDAPGAGDPKTAEVEPVSREQLALLYQDLDVARSLYQNEKQRNEALQGEIARLEREIARLRARPPAVPTVPPGIERRE